MILNHVIDCNSGYEVRPKLINKVMNGHNNIIVFVVMVMNNYNIMVITVATMMPRSKDFHT